MDERLQYQIDTMQAFGEGQPIELRSIRKFEGWLPCPNPVWDWRKFDYRVADLTKPSVNWDHVHADYKYLAREEDGAVWLFTKKPRVRVSAGIGYWVSDYLDAAVPADNLASMTPGTCDWKDSLVTRP